MIQTIAIAHEETISYAVTVAVQQIAAKFSGQHHVSLTPTAPPLEQVFWISSIPPRVAGAQGTREGL